MQALPTKVKLYIAAVVTAAASILVFRGQAFLHPSLAHAPTYWMMLAGFLAADLLTATKKVKLSPPYGSSTGTAEMSVAFAVNYAAVMCLGPEAGFLCGVATAISAGIYPRRLPYYQIVFNAATLGVSAYATGIAYVGLNHGLGLNLHSSFRSIFAIFVSTLVFYLINTTAVSGIIALTSSKRAAKVWGSFFFWTAPGFLAGASLAGLAVYLVTVHNYLLAFFLAPVLFLVYYSYRIYVDKIAQKEEHIQALEGNQKELADLYLSTVRSLAMAIDAKDQHTHEHILRVQRYAMAIAQNMSLSTEDMDAVRTGSLLHDVGKLGVPEYVLLKPGRLTDDEFEKIKRHPTIGADILSPVNFPSPVIAIVKHHHERWDGKGYPDGLIGEEIPQVARILAVADVFDALTSSRSYRRAWDSGQAKEHIRKSAGTHFDPAIVDVFLNVIDDVAAEIEAEQRAQETRENVGSLAALAGDRVARAARRIHRANAELWALYETTQMLGTGMGTQDTVNLLVGKILEAFSCSACLFLIPDDQDVFHVAKALGINDEYFHGASLHKGAAEGPIRRVLRTSLPERGPYEKEEMMLTGTNTPWREMPDSLIVPLLHDGTLLGTINLYSDQAEFFTDDDQHFLTIVARHAAAALHNARLLDRTRTDAYTDQLTGLANVRAFMNSVDEWMPINSAIPGPPRVALLFIDLDNFKPINDNFGHQKGDEILSSAAQVIRRHIRPIDKAIRYGGDEFLIILPGTDQASAQTVAERLETAISVEIAGLPHPIYGEVKVEASVGIANYPEDGLDFPSLLSAADRRMYSVKTQRKLAMLSRDPLRTAPAIRDGLAVLRLIEHE